MKIVYITVWYVSRFYFTLIKKNPALAGFILVNKAETIPYDADLFNVYHGFPAHVALLSSYQVAILRDCLFKVVAFLLSCKTTLSLVYRQPLRGCSSPLRPYVQLLINPHQPWEPLQNHILLRVWY